MIVFILMFYMKLFCFGWTAPFLSQNWTGREVTRKKTKGKQINPQYRTTTISTQTSHTAQDQTCGSVNECDMIDEWWMAGHFAEAYKKWKRLKDK